jgi:hypothetical protein
VGGKLNKPFCGKLFHFQEDFFPDLDQNTALFGNMNPLCLSYEVHATNLPN